MRLRECEQSCRQLNAVLQVVHTSGGIEKIPELVKEIKDIFEKSVRPQVVALFETVPMGPPSQYYRFHHVFNFTLQRLVFFAAMAHYLETEQMLLRVKPDALYIQTKQPSIETCLLYRPRLPRSGSESKTTPRMESHTWIWRITSPA